MIRAILKNTKQLLISIVVLTVLFIGLYPFQSYLSHKIYPILPINLCFLSYGSTFDIDVFTNNRKDCFGMRAYEKKDWHSCLFTYNPGDCLASVSLKTNNFLCLKTSNKTERNSCYQYTFINGHDLVHQLYGIQEFKKNKSITGKVGDQFAIPLTQVGKYYITLLGYVGEKVEINNNSRRLYCSKNETTPVPVVSSGGGYQSIYIDACRITNNGIITLDYFKYEFPDQSSFILDTIEHLKI